MTVMVSESSDAGLLTVKLFMAIACLVEFILVD